MTKVLIPQDKALEQLLEGAKMLYDAVSTTLGPLGRNVLIGAYGEPIVTHDGVTVAKSIEDVEGATLGALIGIEMIKSSSSKTNDNAGDGTTSSTIIAYHLMSRGIDILKSKNAMVLRRELDNASEEALAILSTLVEDIETEDQAVQIATISSENKDIGKNVGHIYHVLGKDGMVVVEIGEKPVIEYKIVEGYTFDRGFISPMQITDSRTQSTTLKNPAILVAHNTPSLKDVTELINELQAHGVNSLVIVCNDFKTDLLDDAIASTIEDFQVIGVRAPGFGDARADLLRDIAAIAGTEAVGNKLPKKISDLRYGDLGTAKEVVITLNETVITGGSDVSEHTKDLEQKIKTTKGDFERSKIEKRVAQLKAKVGHILVGGNTEMEAEERKYLVDDAVAATEAALKDGIVPGGATTYIEISRRLGDVTDGQKLLKEALEGPFKVLMSNAGEKYGVKLEQLTDFGKGFDILGNGELVDLKEHGVIDPAKVIRQAITNAVSVAGSLLTTGHIVANKKETKKDEDDD